MNDRLEYLRGEIRAERISQGELYELQTLADEIDPGDVELLEWAGVPEFPCRTCGGRTDDGEGWDGECGMCADRRARAEEEEDKS